MSVLYQAVATATGGRNGHVRSSDGILDLDLSMPKALGGPGKPFPNPEMLFAAGYAACFENAVLHVARLEKLQPTSTEVEARVGLVRRDPVGFALTVSLRVTVKGLSSEEARNLVSRAHEICPYSNAVRNNIAVEIEVIA